MLRFSQHPPQAQVGLSDYVEPAVCRFQSGDKVTLTMFMRKERGRFLRWAVSTIHCEQNTGVDSLSLLQGIFPTQRSSPGLPHCGLILYQLNRKGSLLNCHLNMPRHVHFSFPNSFCEFLIDSDYCSLKCKNITFSK